MVRQAGSVCESNTCPLGTSHAEEIHRRVRSLHILYTDTPLQQYSHVLQFPAPEPSSHRNSTSFPLSKVRFLGRHAREHLTPTQLRLPLLRVAAVHVVVGDGDHAGRECAFCQNSRWSCETVALMCYPPPWTKTVSRRRWPMSYGDLESAGVRSCFPRRPCLYSSLLPSLSSLPLCLLLVSILVPSSSRSMSPSFRPPPPHLPPLLPHTATHDPHPPQKYRAIFRPLSAVVVHMLGRPFTVTSAFGNGTYIAALGVSSSTSWDIQRAREASAVCAVFRQPTVG